MTEIYINNERLDLFEKTVIAPSYQAGNIADFDTVQANFTNTIKLPLTPRNSKILDNIGIFNYNSSFNKEIQLCEIRNNGIIVMQGKAIVESIGFSEFELNCFGGNYNFFSTVKDLFLHHLDTQEHDFIKDVPTVASLMNQNDGVVFSLTNYGTLDTFVPIEQFFFSYYVKTIVNKIFLATDFDKQGDVFSDLEYQNLVLPFSNTTYKICEIERKSENVSYAVSETVQEIDFNDIVFINTNWNLYSAYMVISNSIKVQWVCDIEFYSLSNDLIVLLQSTNPKFNAQHTITARNEPFREKIYFKSEQALALNDFVLRFQSVQGIANVNIKSIRLYALSETKKTVDKMQVGYIPDSYKILVNENLPKVSQTEFLKEIAKLFGIVFMPNVDGSVIKFTKIEEIFTSSFELLDFSNKLDLSKDIEVSTNYGKYAKVNNFVYDNDATVSDSNASYTQFINNNTLEDSVDFIKSFFSSCSNIRLFNTDLALIDIFTTDKDGNLEFTGIKNRIAIVSEHTTLIQLRNYDNSQNQNVTTYKKSDTVALNWITLFNKYYSSLFASLQDIKLVRCSLDITPFDVSQTDFSNLVYISYFNSYFYVVKIEQVKDGQSNKVTLLKV